MAYESLGEMNFIDFTICENKKKENEYNFKTTITCDENLFKKIPIFSIHLEDHFSLIVDIEKL